MIRDSFTSNKMLAGESDLARNNATTSKVGQTLEDSQRNFAKWAPTYDQVCFYIILFKLYKFYPL